MSWIDTFGKFAMLIASAGAKQDTFESVMSLALKKRAQDMKMEMFEKTLEEEKRQFDESLRLKEEELALDRERFEFEKNQLLKTQESLAKLFEALNKPSSDFKGFVKQLEEGLNRVAKAIEQATRPNPEPQPQGSGYFPPIIEYRPFNLFTNDSEMRRLWEFMMESEQQPSYPMDVRTGTPVIVMPETSYPDEVYINAVRLMKSLSDAERTFGTGATRSLIERFFEGGGR